MRKNKIMASVAPVMLAAALLMTGCGKAQEKVDSEGATGSEVTKEDTTAEETTETTTAEDDTISGTSNGSNDGTETAATEPDTKDSTTTTSDIIIADVSWNNDINESFEYDPDNHTLFTFEMSDGHMKQFDAGYQYPVESMEKVDIDNDGEEEYLFNTQFGNTAAEYNVVFIFKLVDGEVKRLFPTEDIEEIFNDAVDSHVVTVSENGQTLNALEVTTFDKDVDVNGDSYAFENYHATIICRDGHWEVVPFDPEITFVAVNNGPNSGYVPGSVNNEDTVFKFYLNDKTTKEVSTNFDPAVTGMEMLDVDNDGEEEYVFKGYFSNTAAEYSLLYIFECKDGEVVQLYPTKDIPQLAAETQWEGMTEGDLADSILVTVEENGKTLNAIEVRLFGKEDGETQEEYHATLVCRDGHWEEFGN